MPEPTYNFQSVLDWNFNWVRRSQRVKILRSLNSFDHELAPNLVVRVQMVYSKPAYPGGKSFVEPKL